MREVFHVYTSTCCEGYWETMAVYMCSGLSRIDHNCVPHCTHHLAFNVVVCVCICG